MPAFCTSRMHIFVVPAAADNPSSKFRPVQDKDFHILTRAVDDAFEKGAIMDVVMNVTFCSDVFFDQEHFHSLIDYVKDGEECARVASVTPQCITAMTTAGYIVTILIFGATKFIEKPPTENDDSFEEEEDLTQKNARVAIGNHPITTPRK